MDRTLFTEEHDAFRKAFRQFADARDHSASGSGGAKRGRSTARSGARPASAGFLCPWLEEKYGGAGSDFLASTVMIEELARHVRERLRDGAALGRRRAVHRVVRHRRAEAALAARVASSGELDHRDRHDRARRRLGPRGARRRPRSKTATTTSSTARRRSSRTASCATSCCSPRRPIRIRRTRTAASRCSSSRRTRKGFIKGKRLHKMGIAVAGHERAVLRGLPRAGREPPRYSSAPAS